VIRILLVGGHKLCRQGLRALLQSSAETEVIEEAATSREAIRLAEKLKPCVILMDTAKADAQAIEATRQIHGAQPDIRIIVLSARTGRQHLFEALQAGAVGFVSKDSTATELLAAIRAVAARGTYLSPLLADLVLDDYFRRAQGKTELNELAILSGREREVLQLIADGRSSSEIAQVMRISARTVDTHRHNIMKKLDIHSIAGLTNFAIRHGLSSL
jgi:DNA-binding NarL/FixJ family response regulator